MTHVVVIGGGFSGVAAVKRLIKAGADISVTLIDQRETSDFLPLLPDIIGQKIEPQYAHFSLRNMCSKRGVEFVCGAVTRLDFDKRTVFVGEKAIAYDYLVLASGSETNFYGNDEIARKAYTLDNVDDAGKILQILKAGDYQEYVIVGGGYTGIEIATNLWAYFKKHDMQKHITIVQITDAILNNLPQLFREYAIDNLKQLGIEVKLKTSVDRYDDNTVSLSSGKVINQAALIWSAGVRTVEYIQELAVEKTPQGRLTIDEFLRLNERVFVVGDGAGSVGGNDPVRMGVQFSIMEGQRAAGNILRSIYGKALKRCKLVDLGYIIPMANGRSCGKVLGITVWGRLATFFHYFMCSYRSIGIKNKLGILRCVLRR